MAILKLKPVFKETLWGSDRLNKQFGLNIPSNKTGEAWVASAHQNGDCLIENGAFAGRSLSELYASHRDLFGLSTSTHFPLLVKIIDACDDLSIQVHPDDEFARENGDDCGKTECWYVLSSEIKTTMILGHKAKDLQEVKNAILDKKFDSILHRFKIKRHDFYMVPAGTVHAICAGSLIYEVQQNSDTTYRLYDFDRKDAEGQTRPLHLEKGLEVIKFPSPEVNCKPRVIAKDGILMTEYVDNDFFKVFKLRIHSQGNFPLSGSFYIIGVLEGKPNINGLDLIKGDHVISTSDENQLSISGECVLMISRPKP